MIRGDCDSSLYIYLVSLIDFLTLTLTLTLTSSHSVSIFIQYLITTSFPILHTETVTLKHGEAPSGSSSLKSLAVPLAYSKLWYTQFLTLTSFTLILIDLNYLMRI